MIAKKINWYETKCIGGRHFFAGGPVFVWFLFDGWVVDTLSVGIIFFSLFFIFGATFDGVREALGGKFSCDIVGNAILLFSYCVVLWWAQMGYANISSNALEECRRNFLYCSVDGCLKKNKLMDKSVYVDVTSGHTTSRVFCTRLPKN